MGEKVTEQTENTDPALEDILYLVDDPAGTPASAKATVQSVVNTLELNAQTGTSYTAVLGDRAKLVTMDNASANTFTIPTNASVAYPTGSCLLVSQLGAGITTIAGDTGVTVQGGGASVSAGSAAMTNRYDVVTCIKIATDTWAILGDIGTIS